MRRVFCGWRGVEDQVEVRNAGRKRRDAIRKLKTGMVKGRGMEILQNVEGDRTTEGGIWLGADQFGMMVLTETDAVASHGGSHACCARIVWPRSRMVATQGRIERTCEVVWSCAN